MDKKPILDVLGLELVPCLDFIEKKEVKLWIFFFTCPNPKSAQEFVLQTKQRTILLPNRASLDML
jgi:hypothetical protein